MNKNIFFLTVLVVLFASCSDKKKDSFAIDETLLKEYDDFGAKISSGKVLYADLISEKYENMTPGDTVDIAFTGTVNAVCKAKGCWMKIALNDGKETMVKFKDYGFFVPKDIENDTVIVRGKAFVSEMSVEDQRHFASDAGKSEAEIAAITQPKKTYSLVADGVLVKK